MDQSQMLSLLISLAIFFYLTALIFKFNLNLNNIFPQEKNDGPLRKKIRPTLYRVIR